MSVTQPGPEDRTDLPPAALSDGDGDAEEARGDAERSAEQRLAAGGDALPPGPSDIQQTGPET